MVVHVMVNGVVKSDKFFVQETGPSPPVSEDMEITLPLQPAVVEIADIKKEPNVYTRSRKPKKKEASTKKRKPVPERKLTPSKEPSIMDTTPPVEPLPPTEDENVFASTPRSMVLRKRKLESPLETPCSLRRKLRNDFNPPQGVDNTQLPPTSRVVLIDFLKELNISSKNISKDSRFRLDPSGNIELIKEKEINPPVPSTSQALTHQGRPSLYRQLAQLREEIDGLKKEYASKSNFPPFLK
jgi:hypothetical protein